MYVRYCYISPWDALVKWFLFFLKKKMIDWSLEWLIKAHKKYKEDFNSCGKLRLLSYMSWWPPSLNLHKIPPIENLTRNVFHRNLGILEKVNVGKISIIVHDVEKMFIIIVLISFSMIAIWR